MRLAIPWLVWTSGCGSADFSAGESDLDETDVAWDSGAEPADTEDGSSEDTEEPYIPPEEEADRLLLRPAETDRYLFVANPESDAITRVDVTTLAARTVEVGRSPAGLLITPDQQTAVVLHSGEATVRLVDAETLAQRTVPVRANLNTMALSPDGRWAVLWHDIDGDVTAGTPAAVSYAEVSLIDIQAGVDRPLVVGFAPKGFRFTADSRRAVAVADAQLAVLDLSGAAPTASFLPVADPIAAPSIEEIELAASGRWAWIRQEGQDVVLAVDLDSAEVTTVPVGAGATDLDLTSDGARVVVICRSDAEAWVLDAEDPAGAARIVAIPDELPLGSATIADDGTAVLFTNASLIPRYAVWHIADDAMRLLPLAKPPQTIATAPDGHAIFVVHPVDDAPDGSTPIPFRGKPAISVIDLDDNRTNTLGLTTTVRGYTLSDDSRQAYAVLSSGAWLESFDLNSLLHDEVRLASQPVYVGVLPDTTPDDGDRPQAWVSQEHPLGRLTFFDPDDRSTRTITGFALNGAIED